MTDPAAPDAPADEEPQSRNLMRRLIAALSHEEEGGGAAAASPLGMPGLANLARMRVEDVALPKAEIEAVGDDVTLPELIEVFRRTQLSRIPVFEGTLDSPLGFLHLKDVALRHGFGANGAFDARAEVRPLIYAPPSMPIGVLLAKMQADRMHMALVIDEYGGVDGLVTLEDLVEQVIGEIEDEHDIAEGLTFVEEGPGVWLCQARTSIEELEAAAGRPLVPEDADEQPDTLGGLVFLLAGRVPARGEIVPHPSAGAEIEVVDADPRRVKRLRLRLKDG
ncbi:magnesium and cobalt transporter [Hasllibacter halocynthiae]|uniref:Magnesium and cobalt transporter n=1 Tax=Hasllibacter halocynthiae TaxID=595589 RepID=A0A2T0X131_9RHOB|nr:transporter associated domain-containing protein [Hasllibacter halocynthiae]PRY92656.1 magnesium and cobalt transporter [Hasllibacter halocynthiae]